MTDGDTAGTIFGWLIAAALIIYFLYVCYKGHVNTQLERAGKFPEGLPGSITANPLSIAIQDSSFEKGSKNLACLDGNNSTKNAPSPGGGFVRDDDYNQEMAAMESVHMIGIAKYGYLYKKSTSIRKDWLKRWFFIKDGNLFYTHRPTDLASNQSNSKKNAKVQAVPVANLVISTVKEISPLEFHVISPGQRFKDGSGKPGGVYELQAESAESAREWVNFIRDQIEGSLSSQAVRNAGLSASGHHQSCSSDSINVDKGSSYFFVPSPDILQRLADTNPTCCDCGSPNPKWASLNLCVMMCIECSGIHRSLGTHVSKVRSLTLDSWTSTNIDLMISIGNKRANNLWEERIEASRKPSATSPRDVRERFITEKYVKRSFVAPANEPSKLALQAAATGNVAAVMKAYASGADFNSTLVTAEGADTRKTPLHLAVEGESMLCSELICQFSGVTLDSRDCDGKSVLDKAIASNCSPIIQLLTHHLQAKQA